jgi:hypothetical protein
MTTLMCGTLLCARSPHSDLHLPSYSVYKQVCVSFVVSSLALPTRLPSLARTRLLPAPCRCLGRVVTSSVPQVPCHWPTPLHPKPLHCNSAMPSFLKTFRKMSSTKAQPEKEGPSNLDVIFACSVCGDTLADVYKDHDESVQGFSDGINNKERLVARLYISSCCHVFCIKHIEDGNGEPTRSL